MYKLNKDLYQTGITDLIIKRFTKFDLLFLIKVLSLIVIKY